MLARCCAGNGAEREGGRRAEAGSPFSYLFLRAGFSGIWPFGDGLSHGAWIRKFRVIKLGSCFFAARRVERRGVELRYKMFGGGRGKKIVITVAGWRVPVLIIVMNCFSRGYFSTSNRANYSSREWSTQLRWNDAWNNFCKDSAWNFLLSITIHWIRFSITFLKVKI